MLVCVKAEGTADAPIGFLPSRPLLDVAKQYRQDSQLQTMNLLSPDGTTVAVGLDMLLSEVPRSLSHEETAGNRYFVMRVQPAAVAASSSGQAGADAGAATGTQRWIAWKRRFTWPQRRSPHTCSVPLDVPTSALMAAHPDTKLSDAFGRVSRLEWNNNKKKQTIGTCVRVFAGDAKAGYVLVARHCVVCEGKCLKEMSAFGGKLQFIAARPDLDMALFSGPNGPSFQVATDTTSYVKGSRITLLSYPKAMDVELSNTVDTPALDNGVVSQLARHGKYMATTFSTGMPNSSGGAVLTDTQTLAGVHMGIIFHLDEAGGSSSGGSSSGGGSSGGCGRSGPPREIERDPNNMWEDTEEGAIAAAAADTAAAAELSRLNIGHKSCAGLSVTALALWDFLDEALGIPEPVNIADVKGATVKKPRLE